MYFADAAALRSADLSRQVGAAILTKHGEVLAVGMNDVPRSGGGLYWDGDGDDKRDFVRKGDSNEEMKKSILREVLEKVDPEWQRLDEYTREARIEEHAGRLGGARIMNLTEFGRAVHAEMEAITAAARSGIPIRGATLYTTTFPCHNCAKHIVAAGIDRVVYVEPYPKSLALDLHDDSICLDENTLVDDDKHKVRFESFVGIAPRRYASLFSTVTPDGLRVRRKTKGGKIVATPLGVRQKASPLSYIEREFAAALIASKIGELPKQESPNEPTGTAP
jgi:deoxycytidylate deaminase